jgi:hypothetical protein
MEAIRVAHRPLGAVSGVYRVKCGAWYDFGGVLRSVYRIGETPSCKLVSDTFVYGV